MSQRNSAYSVTLISVEIASPCYAAHSLAALPTRFLGPDASHYLVVFGCTAPDVGQ